MCWQAVQGPGRGLSLAWPVPTQPTQPVLPAGAGDDSGLSNGAPPPLGPSWQTSPAPQIAAPHTPPPHTHPPPPPPLPPPDALLSGVVCGGGGEAVPLARSVSLAIPIPLFICEHYSMAQKGGGHAAPCYLHPEGSGMGSQQVARARSCCLDHHLSLQLQPGVPRSHSWGSGTAARPHCRSSSTQTLPPNTLTPTTANTPATPPGE